MCTFNVCLYFFKHDVFENTLRYLNGNEGNKETLKMGKGNINAD